MQATSLQCSWIKRLFDNNFHQWNLIPLYLIRQYLGKKIKLHSNLEVSHSISCKFPNFPVQMFLLWVYDETPHHIFHECAYAQNLWNRLRLYRLEKVALSVLNPQIAIFGFIDVSDHNSLLVKHLLLIFKYNVYNSRVNNSLNLEGLKRYLSNKIH